MQKVKYSLECGKQNQADEISSRFKFVQAQNHLVKIIVIALTFYISLFVTGLLIVRKFFLTALCSNLSPYFV